MTENKHPIVFEDSNGVVHRVPQFFIMNADGDIISKYPKGPMKRKSKPTRQVIVSLSQLETLEDAIFNDDLHRREFLATMRALDDGKGGIRGINSLREKCLQYMWKERRWRAVNGKVMTLPES